MLHLPLARPRPDARRFVDVLMGRRQGKPPLIEYLVDDALRKPITMHLLGRTWVDNGDNRADKTAYLDNFIEFWYRLGYDFVRYEESMGFARHNLLAPDTALGVHKQRAWADEHRGMIRTWQDFEAYPWPAIEQVDFFATSYTPAVTWRALRTI